MSVDPVKPHAVSSADAPVPQGTLSPERMQAVLRRLADGFYDRADVRSEIACRVARDIRT